MKIDFNAKFSDVNARLAKANTVTNIPKAEFGKLLGEYVGNKPKTEEIQADMPKPGKADADTMKGRFNFSPLKFVMPPVQLHAAPIVEEKHEDPGVKIPTDDNAIDSIAPHTIESKKSAPIKDAYAGLNQGERKEKVQALVERAAEKYGIDPALSLAVASVESSFNPAATSQDGHFSKGLMQLLDSTGKEHLEQGENYKPYDPEQNVTLGVSYLRKLHDMFTSPETLANNLTTVPAANSSSLEKIAVAAYNAGEGRVAWAQDQAVRAGKNPASFDDISGYLPEITQQYVSKVISTRKEFEARFQG